MARRTTRASSHKPMAPEQSSAIGDDNRVDPTTDLPTSSSTPVGSAPSPPEHGHEQADIPPPNTPVNVEIQDSQAPPIVESSTIADDLQVAATLPVGHSEPTTAKSSPSGDGRQPQTPKKNGKNRRARPADSQQLEQSHPIPIQTPPKTTKPPRKIHDIQRSKVVESHRMATAVLCVAALDPIWPGESGPQRTVDQAHVKELADRFSAGITRSAPGHRLDVTMSQDLLTRSIRQTVKVINNSNPAPVMPITEEIVRSNVRAMMDETSDQFSHYPVLYLPDDYDMSVEPIVLQSGQHRVAALLQLYSRFSTFTGYTPKLFTPKTVQQLGWVCNIADAATVGPEYFEAVRPNRHDQYKEADQGTFFANLKAAGDLLSDEQRIKVFGNESNWVEWATATVGLPKSSVGRFYTLVKDEKVSAVLYEWVRHAFGRETFVASQWTSIQSQRMWGFWQKKFKKFWNFFNEMTETLTPAQRINISSQDLSLISQASDSEIGIDYSEGLRRVFFPTPQDCNERIAGIPVDRRWWAQETAGEYKRFVLKPPVSEGCTFRRPEFLRVLNNTDYADFYQILQHMEYQVKHNMESPEQLMKSITAIGQPLSHLYRHILFWFRPEFEVPVGAQYLKLKSYDVQAKAESVIFEVPPVDVEIAMVEQDKTLEQLEAERKQQLKEANMKAISLHRKLTEIVTKRSDIFDVTSNTKALWMFKEHDLANMALTIEQREEYLDIWAKMPYFSILQLVLSLADRSRLEGCMYVLRSAGSEQLLRETLPSLEPVQNALTKVYKRRFTDLEASESGMKSISRMESAVHKGLEYLIPLLEFAKLQQVYLDTLKRREEAKVTGKGAASVMPANELELYTAQLQRFIQHLRPYGIHLSCHTPLSEVNLPDASTLLTPRAAPGSMPLRLETRTYQPPASPRKPVKKAKGGRPKAGTTPKEKTEPNKKRRRRQMSSSEDDEAAASSDSSSSDQTPLPAGKRRRLKG